MPARDEDDFSAFVGSEQMFFGLRDPYGMIREELQRALREQIPDTEVVSIATLGEPKFLTLGRKGDGGEHMLVTHFAFAVRARVAVLFDERRKGELLEAALTFLFADVDVPGAQKVRTHFDLHQDADKNFSDELFKQRFMSFRGQGQAS